MIFFIPGPIKGKARARTFYDPRLGKHRSVTPRDTAVYENWVKTCYIKEKERTGHRPFFNGEPLDVYITSYYEIPKSTTKANRIEIAEGRLHPTKKPDADNIAKSICDALNGIAYGDDKQIVMLVIQKRYAQEGQEGYTLVSISEHKAKYTEGE